MLTDDQMESLIAAARSAADRAYAPYSGFAVGAALLTANGAVITGGNVENASYGLTICAERSAIVAAVAAGHREVMAIAVSAPGAPGTTPCGACRQVLNEFVPRDGELVILLDGEAGIEAIQLSDLLPRAFGPRSLDRERAISHTDGE